MNTAIQDMPAVLRLYLGAGEYVDSDHPDVIARAERLGGGTPTEQARRIYDFVRDEILYNPYCDYGSPETYRASAVLAAGNGYCVGKASLYAALCRAAGIPARIGLADVRNHLATPRLRELAGDDVFRWHGYAEIHLGAGWVKVTPTFNRTLCEKLDVPTLPFDGRTDALLQPFDAEGRTFMQYLDDYGTFFDVPGKFLRADMLRLYPRLVAVATGSTAMEDDV